LPSFRAGRNGCDPDGIGRSRPFPLSKDRAGEH
jgi:hypothetical protein